MVVDEYFELFALAGLAFWSNTSSYLELLLISPHPFKSLVYLCEYVVWRQTNSADVATHDTESVFGDYTRHRSYLIREQ